MYCSRSLSLSLGTWILLYITLSLLDHQVVSSHSCSSGGCPDSEAMAGVILHVRPHLHVPTSFSLGSPRWLCQRPSVTVLNQRYPSAYQAASGIEAILCPNTLLTTSFNCPMHHSICMVIRVFLFGCPTTSKHHYLAKGMDTTTDIPRYNSIMHINRRENCLPGQTTIIHVHMWLLTQKFDEWCQLALLINQSC